MERVQFQQEQMLAELKDLEEKGLFTRKEVKQIMKKRTVFETALVRRISKKNDYLRYITYEMGLESLRKKRAERLKIASGPPTISDYALVRRQFHIFERALKRFKSDVALWIQYIQVAKKEGAKSLVGRITARALQLHPNVPALYILAASHELQHLSPSAARTLLQRGIRLNSDSVEMWREYVKMELGFVESLRRRWDVLGIDLDPKQKGKERANESEEQVERMQDQAEEDNDEGEKARRDIMKGAIVKSVIANAVKALPKAELFISLHQLVSTYPCPAQLRDSLLDFIFDLLQETIPYDPEAVKLAASRFLITSPVDPGFVDSLKQANETFVATLKAMFTRGSQADGVASVYAAFVDEWCTKAIDPNLVTYLIASLQSLVQASIKANAPSIPLTIAHLTIITRLHNTASTSVLSPPEKTLKLAQKYTNLQKPSCTSSRLWLARLNAEKAFLPPDKLSSELEKTLKAARSSARGDGVIDVWMWGIDEVDSADNKSKPFENLLNESMRMQDSPSWRDVHEGLLVRYATYTLANSPECKTNEAESLSFIKRIKRDFLPSQAVWEACFTLISSSTSPSAAALNQVYTFWCSLDRPNASLAYAAWLLEAGRSKESVQVISECLAQLSGGEKEEVERRWRAVVNVEGDKMEDDSMQVERTSDVEEDDGSTMMD